MGQVLLVAAASRCCPQLYAWQQFSGCGGQSPGQLINESGIWFNFGLKNFNEKPQNNPLTAKPTRILISSLVGPGLHSSPASSQSSVRCTSAHPTLKSSFSKKWVEFGHSKPKFPNEPNQNQCQCRSLDGSFVILGLTP